MTFALLRRGTQSTTIVLTAREAIADAATFWSSGNGLGFRVEPGRLAYLVTGNNPASFAQPHPTQPLNVCCVLELDTSTMPGGYAYGRLRAALAKHVKALPEFRMKLADTQLNLDHPVWVDDDNFQLRRHLQRVGVPAPGGGAGPADRTSAVTRWPSPGRIR